MSILLKRRFLLIFSILSSMIFFIVLLVVGFLPVKYLLLILVLLALAFLTLYRCEKDKHHEHPIKTIILKMLHLLLSLILIIASIYIGKTNNFLSTITGGKDQIITVDVVVSSSKHYNNIKELKDGTFGINTSKDSIVLTKAKATLQSDLELDEDLNVTDYEEDASELYALTQSSIDAVIIKESDYEDFLDENESYEDITEVLYQIEVRIAAVSANSANVTKEAFCVYISGCDKTGDIDRGDALSDVNMLAVVNPNTRQILMVSIPRDYYVDIIDNGTNIGKDKLTHSAKKYMQCQLGTVSNLLDCDINYYAKFNFTSFMNVIDALGGTIRIKIPNYDTYSGDGTFTTKKGHYTFKCGETYDMTSKQALCFVRERKSFVKGDEVRGKNQMLMLKAIIKKCCSTAILTHMDSIFNSLSSSFDTNMSSKEVKALINFQLNDNQAWDLQSYRLTGDSSIRTTQLATVGEANVIRANPNGLFICQPDEESVSTAKEYIQQVLTTDEPLNIKD